MQLRAKAINFKAATSRICHAVASSDRSFVWSQNYAVARKIGIESSALGRITGACRVTVGQESFDVGLSLRHGNDLCVPGMSRPSPEGTWPCFPACDVVAHTSSHKGDSFGLYDPIHADSAA